MRIYKSLFEIPWNNSALHCKVYDSSNGKDELIDRAFSISVGNGSRSHNENFISSCRCETQ